MDFLTKAKVGDLIKIIEMKGEPSYTDAIGYVTAIDDAGQIHGTWGGCAVVDEEDTYMDYEIYKFKIKNLSDKTITSIEITMTYSTGTGATQSFGVYLSANGTETNQTMQLRGKTTNGTATVTFSNLNIPADSTFSIRYESVKTNDDTANISNVSPNSKYICFLTSS